MNSKKKVETSKREPLLKIGKGEKVGKSSHPGVWRGGADGTGSGLPIKRQA